MSTAKPTAILSFSSEVRLSGEAHQDVVTFFGNVDAASDSSIGGDLVSFFGSVRLDKTSKSAETW